MCVGLVLSLLVPVSSFSYSMDRIAPSRSDSSRVYPSARYTTTLQDHFDTSNVATWQQAYFVNDTFWLPGSDAPVFLCVGGEGPALEGDAVVDSVHCSNAAEWLEEKNALMFALEHRYYGCHNISACPVTDFSDEKVALAFLSSRQAVEDVANFVRRMNDEYGLSNKNKWVTWGGSYPGMMAAWSRLKHPELIHASVASSAPVLAQLDMPEYNDRVASAYAVSDNGVGGSQECTEAIRKGHEVVGSLLQSQDGQSRLETIFGLSSGYLQTASSQRQFAGQGVAYFPAQGNDPTCESAGCNIGNICAIMLDESHGEELLRLAYLSKVQQGGKAVDVSVPTYSFWFYQTCTEFGFYQTCETNSSCFFTRGLSTLEHQTAGCSRWDISPSEIEASIEATNAHYGGVRPTGPDGQLGSCVMWPNGEVDPWAGLSVLESPGQEQPVLYVGGASHHAWTHASATSDQPSVGSARLTIRDQVDAFLQQDCSLTNVVNV